MAEFKSTAILSYVQEVSVPLRCCLEQQGIHAVFNSDMTLRSHLLQPKNTAIRQNKMAWFTGFSVSVEKSHQGNREIHAGENQRARQGYTTRPYPDPQ